MLSGVHEPLREAQIPARGDDGRGLDEVRARAHDVEELGHRRKDAMCELLQSLAVTPEPPTGARVGIIGLGYVGLPLAVAFAEAGADVVGIDVDPTKIEAIAAGRSYIEDVASERLQGLTSAGRIRATTDASALDDREAILICLPTPLDEHRSPDLAFVARRGRDRHRAPRPGRSPRPRIDDLAGHDPGGHRADARGERSDASARTASLRSARSASTRETRAGASERRRRSSAA